MSNSRSTRSASAGYWCLSSRQARRAAAYSAGAPAAPRPAARYGCCRLPDHHPRRSRSRRRRRPAAARTRPQAPARPPPRRPPPAPHRRGPWRGTARSGGSRGAGQYTGTPPHGPRGRAQSAPGSARGGHAGVSLGSVWGRGRWVTGAVAGGIQGQQGAMCACRGTNPRCTPLARPPPNPAPPLPLFPPSPPFPRDPP